MKSGQTTVDWNGLTLQPNTRCRIETPTISPTNALITRVDRQSGILLIFGKTHGREAIEQPLARIDTQGTRGELQTTAADGIVLKWFHPEQGGGTLMTFPRRNGKA